MEIKMDRPVISLVGCGFVGSHLADEIPKLLFSQDIFGYHIKFIDFDTWEGRNAANQNVSQEEAESGAYKADTCRNLASKYRVVTAEAVNEKLTPQNAGELIRGSDLVIDAVDNIPTRQLLWALAKGGATGPCMHVGISRKGDGIINWSSPNFDTFPFNPANIAGRDLQEQDVKEPPCEMYKYRASGMMLFQATAKAAGIFFGRDPWDYLGLGGQVEQGTMTCWDSSIEMGSNVKADEMFIDRETGFFPVFNRED